MLYPSDFEAKAATDVVEAEVRVLKTGMDSLDVIGVIAMELSSLRVTSSIRGSIEIRTMSIDKSLELGSMAYLGRGGTF